MSHTHRLKLPYIISSQAQKEATHNEALEIIDVLLHASAVSIEDVPPAAPKRGDCYIVSNQPQCQEERTAWEDHPNALAYYTTGWNFIEAFEGLTVWVSKERCHYTYDGAGWEATGMGKDQSTTQNSKGATAQLDKQILPAAEESDL